VLDDKDNYITIFTSNINEGYDHNINCPSRILENQVEIEGIQMMPFNPAYSSHVTHQFELPKTA